MKMLAMAARHLRRAFNRELNQWSYNWQTLNSAGVPEVFQVELTNHCPMTCIMCRSYAEARHRLEGAIEPTSVPTASHSAEPKSARLISTLVTRATASRPITRWL